MAFSKTTIILSAFLVIFILTVLMNKVKRDTTNVVTYTIGDDADDETDGEHELLHVEQVLQRALPGGNLTVVISSQSSTT